MELLEGIMTRRGTPMLPASSSGSPNQATGDRGVYRLSRPGCPTQQVRDHENAAAEVCEAFRIARTLQAFDDPTE